VLNVPAGLRGKGQVFLSSTKSCIPGEEDRLGGFSAGMRERRLIPTSYKESGLTRQTRKPRCLAGTKEVGERELERKEVVVAGKAFDLGLKGLDDAITEGERDGRSMELEVAGRVFPGGCELSG